MYCLQPLFQMKWPTSFAVRNASTRAYEITPRKLPLYALIRLPWGIEHKIRKAMSDLDESYTLPASWSWMKLYSGRPRKAGSVGAERGKLPVTPREKIRISRHDEGRNVKSACQMLCVDGDEYLS